MGRQYKNSLKERARSYLRITPCGKYRECGNKLFGSITDGEFYKQLSSYFSKHILLQGIISLALITI
jgi:hypothetical protein